MSTDESGLIQRAKEGDPAAFAELYDCYQPAVYRYVLFQVGDVATAEDLTAEVFVRLVEKIHRYSYRGRPLLAWLYTIARNLIIDYRRHTGRYPLFPLNERLVAGTSDPEQATERTLTQERLAACIARLTDAQRRVILLKFFEGMDNQTVAHILGRSVGAVKSLQHRGLAELRRILEQNED